MKKIMLVLFALLVLTLPFQQTYHQANAAIASKAASAAAKKIAKEYIKDMAIAKSVGLAADTTKKLVNEPSRMQKEGYMLMCMDYSYKPGDKCAKPANVKTNLTETDKANIGKQSEIEMEKSLTNGKGMSKWAKFLDWFVPIWLVTFTFTALTYALDPDVKSLFDEVAYNTLVALGLISPVETTDPESLQETLPEVDANGKYTDSTGGIVDAKTYTLIYPTGTKNPHGVTGILNNVVMKDKAIAVYFNLDNNITQTGYKYSDSVDNHNLRFGYQGNTVFLGNVQLEGGANPTFTATVNDEVVWSGTPTIDKEFRQDFTLVPQAASILQKKMQSIMYRTAYEIDGFFYTDVLFNTVDGNTLAVQLQSTAFKTNTTSRMQMSHIYANNTTSTNSATIFFFDAKTKGKVIAPPAFEDADLPEVTGSYQDENGNIALLPPAAFTYIDETTGEQVERVKAPTGDGYVWQKPDGTPVDEGNVIPKPNEEPKITPAPDGTPQYTPAPTPSNPTPQPEPLTPSPTPTPNPTEPPPTEPPPPVDPLPDGPSCAVGLKMPIFSPLKEQLSTSFPFSIPWDIERAAHAAFDGVGSEKPSFDMVIPVGEKIYEAKIETPAFLDKWKPFMDGFLLLTFDMLLMFGLYRFVKGAGS